VFSLVAKLQVREVRGRLHDAVSCRVAQATSKETLHNLAFMGLVFSLQECGSWAGSTSDYHDQTLAVIRSKVSSTTEQKPMRTLHH